MFLSKRQIRAYFSISMHGSTSLATEMHDARVAAGGMLKEALRYLVASAIALAVDAGTYIAMIRIGDVHYLVAGPIGFMLGLVTVYVLSVRWVFHQRRLAGRRSEFVIFTLIGIFGLLVNELVLYVCVERLSMSPELAKLTSAGIVFCCNFLGRKLLLFTRLQA